MSRRDERRTRLVSDEWGGRREEAVGREGELKAAGGETGGQAGPRDSCTPRAFSIQNTMQ